MLVMLYGCDLAYVMFIFEIMCFCYTACIANKPVCNMAYFAHGEPMKIEFDEGLELLMFLTYRPH